MSSPDRRARDARILAAHDRGEPVDAIRGREGLSERQVRRIVASARRASEQALNIVNLDDLDPTELLAEVVAIHREVIDDLARLGRLASPSSAAVGAARARATVAAGLVDLLARAGLVPDAPEWRVLRDVESIAKSLARVAEELGVDLAELELTAGRESRLPPIRITMPEPIRAAA